jgi:hypothetical protein
MASPVDDGTYRITRPGTVVIFKEFPKVTFTYRIIGKNISSHRSCRRAVRRSAALGLCRWPIR